MDKILKTNGRICLKKDQLKRLREKECWSQDKLAITCFENGLCVSLSSVKRAEAGRKVLYRTALGLATIYQVPVNSIINNK